MNLGTCPLCNLSLLSTGKEQGVLTILCQDGHEHKQIDGEWVFVGDWGRQSEGRLAEA